MLGGKIWGETRISGKFDKQRILGFYAKIIADTGFRSAPLDEREKCNQKQNFRKFEVHFLWTFRQIFFNFSAIF